MLPLRASLIFLFCAAPVLGHYGQKCEDDEVYTQISGTDGGLCTPKCGDDDACPQDVPVGDKVKPRCALNGPGGKYCALTCYFGKCPDGASCEWPVGSIVGYCVYKNHSALDSLQNHDSHASLTLAAKGWNLSTACNQVCQPDPVYSASSWCKHKDRGGCCVGVNPNWDKVPGYKHMSDFCDKLCMPDGPGALAMCQPVPETSKITGGDPLDAIDEFYKEHPDECKNRIGDWNEANCRNLASNLVV